MNKQQIFQMYVGSQVLFQSNEYELYGTNKQYDYALLYDDLTQEVFDAPIPDCTLILRPLSSLTDEEKVKLFDCGINDYTDSNRAKIASVDAGIRRMSHNPMKRTMTTEQFLYLLSIGIELFPNP